MRTAGMVQGTPDWQLDRMIESEAAQAWEKHSRTDTECLIISQLNAALEAMHKADSKLWTAVDYADGTPLEAKLRSILDSMELLELAIERMEESL